MRNPGETLSYAFSWVREPKHRVEDGQVTEDAWTLRLDGRALGLGRGGDDGR